MSSTLPLSLGACLIPSSAASNISHCVQIASRGEAMLAVEQARSDFPDARHHCWAYLVGDLVIIVVRYFGGIKLGAGGLVRAYSAAAVQVLDQAQAVPVRETVAFDLSCPFAEEQAIRHWLGQHDGAVVETQYTDAVILHCEVPETSVAVLEEFCRARGIAIAEN